MSTPQITVATATRVGDRTANADAATAITNQLGTCAAVVDGIGSTPQVCAAARLAADVAATVGSHRGAQAAIMAAADTMPEHPDAPNAVAAVASIEPGGRIEIAHVGDAAVWTWASPGHLTRWTADQTAGAQIDHMRTNPALTDDDRRKLDDIVDVLGDYVLNGLKYATVSTVAWTTVRDTTPRLILLTTDGIHKVLGPGHMNGLINRHHDDPQALADALVTKAVEPGDRLAHDQYEEAMWIAVTTGASHIRPIVPLPLGDRDNATAAVIHIAHHTD
ncbi:PP2C family serine/threonine-protein phosphatase [Actinokineospora terrae]|uniref:Serine/threonine protein phosphatase PrpC n=1 Tax=Actinokineospora terrae TaxID=155974 RepID=A0A1H9VH77_9PSEU|nr:PP2C family serine/threonine-protein phosphatase [Actinokineospora terrae]SES20633.1 Serine/threonine protein phosphatase PrpC [Actinokineospora terrae]